MSQESSRIMSLLFSLGRKMREQARPVQKGNIFSYLKFETLRYVKERENPLMKEVAAYLCVTPPSATLLINGLVKEKMLDRLHDRSDRRSIRLRITRKGERMLSEGFRKKVRMIEKVLSKLNARERREFIKILEKLL